MTDTAYDAGLWYFQLAAFAPQAMPARRCGSFFLFDWQRRMFTVQWIGDERATIFSSAFATLRRNAQVETIATNEAARLVVSEVADLDESLHGELALIVVAEKFPGEHPLRLYEVLRRRRPSIPVVRLCGSWCEGELRTHLPPLVPRYAWQAAADEWERDFKLLRAGECPSWGRPATTTIEECMLERFAGDHDVGERLPLRVGLAAPIVAIRAWLGDALRSRFVDVVAIDEQEAAEAEAIDVLVWAASDVGINRADYASAWRRSRPTTPIIALLNFPREHELAALASLGIRALPAVAVLLDDLERAVREAAAAGPVECGKSN